MNDDYNNDYDFEDEFDFDEEEIDLPEDVIYLDEGADAYNKKDYEKANCLKLNFKIVQTAFKFYTQVAAIISLVIKTNAESIPHTTAP